MSTPKDIEKQLAALQTLLEEEQQEITLEPVDDSAGLDVETLDNIDAMSVDKISIDDIGVSVDIDNAIDNSVIEPANDALADERQAMDDALDQFLAGSVHAPSTSMPVLRKSIQPIDFLRYRQHKSDQILFLIRQYLKKHGTPKEDSSELAVLKKAITRILDKPDSSVPPSSQAE